MSGRKRRTQEKPQIHRYATKCLGFDVDPDGVYEINAEELPRVRMVFDLMQAVGQSHSTNEAVNKISSGGRKLVQSVCHERETRS